MIHNHLHACVLTAHYIAPSQPSSLVKLTRVLLLQLLLNTTVHTFYRNC